MQLADQPDLTTRTDFVNSYTALLQTSSYLFMETDTTPKACVGKVKLHVLYDKSPTQYMADIQMLEKKELSSVFKLRDDEPKKTWCVLWWFIPLWCRPYSYFFQNGCSTQIIRD